jgi:hypothetical protein
VGEIRWWHMGSGNLHHLARRSFRGPVGLAAPVLKPPGGSTDYQNMPAGLFDILLVMVGAACMGGGFFIGSWHRRATQRDELDADDIASDERMTRMIRSLIHDDVLGGDERPN